MGNRSLGPANDSACLASRLPPYHHFGARAWALSVPRRWAGSAPSGGGTRLRDVSGLIDGVPVAEPVVELGGGHGPGYEVALRLVAAHARQLGVGDIGLDAFGYDAQVQAVGQG